MPSAPPKRAINGLLLLGFLVALFVRRALALRSRPMRAALLPS
jgi:hypothetical protein